MLLAIRYMGYWLSVRSRWLDIGQVLFCIVYKLTKKKVWGQNQAILTLLITFSGAVRKIFRTCVIFISMERLWNVESKYIKILEIYRFDYRTRAFKLKTIDVRFAELPASALSLTSKQTELYWSELDRLSKCVRHFGSFYWFLRK